MKADGSVAVALHGLGPEEHHAGPDGDDDDGGKEERPDAGGGLRSRVHDAEADDEGGHHHREAGLEDPTAVAALPAFKAAQLDAHGELVALDLPDDAVEDGGEGAGEAQQLAHRLLD